MRLRRAIFWELPMRLESDSIDVGCELMNLLGVPVTVAGPARLGDTSQRARLNSRRRGSAVSRVLEPSHAWLVAVA